MRIALYYPWIYLKSGAERTILEILKGGRHKYTIFTNHYDGDATFPEFKNLKIIELKRVSVKRDLWSVFKAAVVISLQKINLKGYDALFVVSEGLGDLFMFRNGIIHSVCYCLTPLRPVFDEEYKTRVLVKMSILQQIKFKLFSLLFKKIDRFLWSKYSFIFFDSRETLRRATIGGILNIKANNYEVLYPGVNIADEPEKSKQTSESYFFLPGRIMWTKNIELAIKAFIKFKKSRKIFRIHKLIIAGQVDEKSRAYFSGLKKLSGDRKDIIFINSPTDSEMKSLYSKCTAVLSASFNEDFGLTLLEGNSFGKPVIAINNGGPGETQINGVTGILVGESVSEYSRALNVLDSDRVLVNKMGNAAKLNSTKYGWDKFLDILDKRLELLNPS